MLQRTKKLFIGKDINRTATVIAGIGMKHLTESSHLADGEIVVLDKNKCVLAEGASVADSDIIYICQGTGNTFDVTNEAGTTYSAQRKVILSDAIEGAKVKSYSGKSYAAKSEQIDSWACSGITPVLGTEYILRIVYKDVNEHPGQFTQTYRITADGTNPDANFVDLFEAKVNAHSGRRVTASSSTTTLIITGRANPDCTTGLTDLNSFRMVEFETFLIKVSATTGEWSEAGGTLTRTVASYGSGTWEEVRDLERDALPYRGVTNFTAYPVFLPDVCTVKSSTYDLITIEHDRSYVSPDNQYVKRAPLTTQIAFVVPSSGTQETNVLAQLNPWMASCPGSFNNVSV
jgi:hypothetical protein